MSGEGEGLAKRQDQIITKDILDSFFTLKAV